MTKLQVLDLFSGIGGFSLGLERTGGFETKAFCEIDPFCRRVLAKHWPNVPCFEDVTTLRGESVGPVDVICGGFPCQDISIAGLGEGLDGARSGLWFEYARLVGELRPHVVLVENVAALLGRGLDRVLGDLATLGYSAEWHCIPASAVGAPHERDRVWIVAYADDRQRLGSEGQVRAGRHASRGGSETVADTDDSERAPGWAAGRVGRLPLEREIANDGYARRAHWEAEPNVGRVAHGIPHRVDRLRALGNAVVPQIPELIGNAILQSLEAA
jgi:DNA (cytosine-5)-methyltransferase 1